MLFDPHKKLDLLSPLFYRWGTWCTKEVKELIQGNPKSIEFLFSAKALGCSDRKHKSVISAIWEVTWDHPLTQTGESGATSKQNWHLLKVDSVLTRQKRQEKGILREI